MQYLITRISPTSQFIQIRLLIDCEANEFIHLQMAAWRPGRYELANYAQKIRGFSLIHLGEKISWNKVSKDLWQFKAIEKGQYQVDYEFYCNQMDAGGSWSDESQLYLNFSNFIFEVIERKKEEISVTIDLPR